MIRKSYPFLPLDLVESYEPLAARLGVSIVARHAGGFLPIFKHAKGTPSHLSPGWRDKRAGFIARHMAQIEKNREPLYQDDGVTPSRRHLALIMWAYSPEPISHLKPGLRAANPQQCGTSLHDHPARKAPWSLKNFTSLWSKMCKKAGLDPSDCQISFPESLSATHCRNTRRYAQVWTSPLMQPHFEFATQILWLPLENQKALIAHEIGHVLDPEGGEDGADRAGGVACGVTIKYDKRWPGKGLQTC
jgi:hypothetical protein